MTREGTVLDGKYEIWKEVGRGGMSIVYLARDNRLNKQWAVKEIKNDGSKSTMTLLKGLEREANILKNVDHPVLPRIVDIINQEGTIYVVMDFIEGTTLSDRLAIEGAQPQELVIEWGLQLASALDYLHKMNPPVIYRDMKPSNVMIKPEGGVKLIDFGTAKEYDVENIADTTALGTRGYAAPEQFGDAQGRGIYKTDARTDIYNLGATLYHIVTGKNPCEPPYEMRPIREWNPTLSSGLEKIILKCTQANPSDRYQNCSELMYALRHYDELDDTYKKKNKRKLGAFIASSILAIVGGITAAYGHAGLEKIKLQDYNSYIEAGNEYKGEGKYKAAAEQYRLAFELDGSDSEAYKKFIQVYVEANDNIIEKNEDDMSMEACLDVIANKIRTGYDNVDKNDEVLFELALTYLENIRDYKLATKYFKMVDESNPEYGELAKRYCAVTESISYLAVNNENLDEALDKFVEFNKTSYTSQDELKYINYKNIGRIYMPYHTLGDSKKIASYMEDAVKELDNNISGDFDANKYYEAYYDYLSEIYNEMAENEKDEIARTEYYSEVNNYCDEYNNILDIKIDNLTNDGKEIEYKQEYYTTYYNKMSMKAKALGEISGYEAAIEVYKNAEKVIGKDNIVSNKIYAEHLNYIYTYMSNQITDSKAWAEKMENEFSDLIEVYNESQKVKEIDTNKNWKRRSDTIKSLITTEEGKEK